MGYKLYVLSWYYSSLNYPYPQRKGDSGSGHVPKREDPGTVNGMDQILGKLSQAGSNMLTDVGIESSIRKVRVSVREIPQIKPFAIGSS